MKKTFTGNTRLFLCISGAIIVIALVMQIAGAGLNLGIDFTGGSILNYSVGEDYDVSDVETLLNASGYTDNQITKAAPSAASIALQERLAAEAAETVEAVAEAAAEDPEVAAAVDEAVEEAAVEAAVEEAVEEAETPVLGLLNPDKSGIVHDGLTDLQIRLKLADATEGMEDTIKGAVVGVVSNANETGYRTATNQEISTLGYALSYAGGNIIEFDMVGAYDKAAVEEAVKKALEEGGYSVNAIDFIQYDAEAEAARIAEEQAAAEQAQA
ncbi:MAG: hypothetical protein IKE76_01195, partial [Clostridia bacterium]|nr:hypothetical protein [Clostridia bacterium]